MQQTQIQVPTPQQPRRKRFSRNMIIGIACVVALIIGGFWIAVGVGWLPSLFGINPTNLAFIASVVVAILGVLFAFIQNLPSDKISEITPTPVPLNINVNVSPYQPRPVTTLLPPVSAPLPSLTYRGIASLPPPTNAQVVQQREGIVRDIYAILTRQDISGVVLVGIGGIGKSTLAALVRSYVEQQILSGKGLFKRKTLWLRVDENTTFFDIAENLFTILGNKPLGFEQFSPQNQALALFNLLDSSDQPLLVVIDQFENLLDLNTGKALAPETGEFIDALNSRGCSSRILITSRPRPKGTYFDEACLKEYLVGGLDLFEGQNMLRQRGVIGSDVELQNAVKRCKGHSLSLYLLTSLVDENKWSLSTLLRDPSYTQLWDNDIATNLLDIIYTKRLNNEQRELIQSFSIYREAVPQEAVLMLLSEPTKTYISMLLRTLQSQQLIQVVEEGHRQLHPIVATYAQHHDEQFNQATVRIAHGKAAQYYMQQAAKTCPPREERRYVRDVQPLVEAVWHFCQAEQLQEAYDLMEQERLFDNLRLWGGNTLLLDLCQSLLSRDQQLIPLQHASIIYRNMALIYGTLGKTQNSLEYHQKDLSITRSIGEPINQVRSLNGIGGIYHVMGQLGEARKYYNESLDIVRAIGEKKDKGELLSNLGLTYEEEGQLEEALKYYHEALVISQEEKNREIEGTILHNLAKVYYIQGRQDEALKYYNESLVIRREVGDRRGEGTTLNNLGSIYTDLGKKVESLNNYRKALVIRREIGDRRGEGVTLLNIGVLFYIKENVYEVALSCFLLAQGIFIEIESPYIDSVQERINDLRQDLGDQQFAALLPNVEPHPQQIVDDALHEVR